MIDTSSSASRQHYIDTGRYLTVEENAEATVRAFAAQYPTRQVSAAVAYAESGLLTWTQIEGICARALAAAIIDAQEGA